MGQSQVHTETVGTPGSLGGTLRVPGDRVLWLMRNMQKRHSCWFRVKATRRILRDSPRRCTARCDRKECLCNYCSSHVRTMGHWEETLPGDRAQSPGPE